MGIDTGSICNEQQEIDIRKYTPCTVKDSLQVVRKAICNEYWIQKYALGAEQASGGPTLLIADFACAHQGENFSTKTHRLCALNVRMALWYC